MFKVGYQDLKKYEGSVGTLGLSIKLLNSKNLKLRNKTFDWTSKVRKRIKVKLL